MTIAQAISMTHDYTSMIINRLVAGQALWGCAHSSYAQEIILCGARAAIGEILGCFGIVGEQFEVYTCERGVVLRLDDTVRLYTDTD